MHTHYVGCIETRRDWGGPRLLRELSLELSAVDFSMSCGPFYREVHISEQQREAVGSDSSEVTAVTQFPDNYVTRISSQGSMARAPTLLYLIVSSMTLANQASLRVTKTGFYRRVR